MSRRHSAFRFLSDGSKLIKSLKDHYNSSPPKGASRFLRTPLGSLVDINELNKPYIYIDDLKSKFGTLITVDSPLHLQRKTALSIQVSDFQISRLPTGWRDHIDILQSPSYVVAFIPSVFLFVLSRNGRQSNRRSI